MKTDPRKLLYDILTSSEEIRQFTTGMNRQQWLADLRTRRAVERDFGKIGEAMKRIRHHHPELAERIPAKSRITGFRDKLAHEYEDIDSIEVWGYVQNNLPSLVRIVQDLMAELEPQQNQNDDN